MLDFLRKRPGAMAFSVLVHLLALAAAGLYLNRSAPPPGPAPADIIHTVILTPAPEPAQTGPVPVPSPPTPATAPEQLAPAPPPPPTAAELRRLQQRAQQQIETQRRLAEAAIRRMESVAPVADPAPQMASNPNAEETRHVEEQRRRAQREMGL